MLARLCLAVALAALPSLAKAQSLQQWPGVTIYGPNGAPLGTAANPLATTGATGSAGSSPSAPTYTAPAGVTRTRIACTLPAYAAGGNVVCTDSAGQQTTTACAANTACLIAAANANRKTAEWTNRTPGASIDVGYSATVAPGTGKGYDGPSSTGGQGGSGSENPAHVGSYFAATATAGAVLVFVQGQ